MKKYIYIRIPNQYFILQFKIIVRTISNSDETFSWSRLHLSIREKSLDVEEDRDYDEFPTQTIA